MKASERKKIGKWVETWKIADSALRNIKQQELRSYDYLKNMDLVDGMLQWACDHRKLRLNSGLVEQQRLFMKLKEKKAIVHQKKNI